MNDVTRVQTTAESASSMKALAEAHAPTQAETRLSLKSNPGTYSVGLSDGELVEKPYQNGAYRMNTGDALKGDGKTILSTARTPWGTPTADLKDDTLIVHNGMEMALKSAEAAGLVKKVNGQYVEVSADQRAANEEEAPKQDDSGETLGTDMEAHLGQLSEIIPPAHQTSIIENILTKGFDSLNLNDIAYEAGQSADALRGKIGHAMQAFTEQANKALIAAGVSREEIPNFVAWARESRGEEFMGTMREHAYNRNSKGYATLARQWMNATPPDVSALPAKLSPRTVNGETLVTVPGYPEMSLATATRMGLI